MDILTVNTCSCSRIRCQLQWSLSLSPQHDSSSPLMVTAPSAEAHWAVRVSARPGPRSCLSLAFVLVIYDVQHVS